MATPRIYWPDSLSIGQCVTLEPDTVHHLATVLRVKSGEQVFLFNGELEYLATLTCHGKKSAELTVVGKQDGHRESPLLLEFATCLYRGKQFDTAIQKAVELGVHAITPIISHKSDVIHKAAGRRRDQLQKIIIGACEQSGRIKLPTLNAETPFNTWVQQAADKKAIACDFSAGTLDWAKKPMKGELVSVLIGPAGGFTEAESLALSKAKVPNLHLGPRTLRSDTATTISLGLVQHYWGDLV